VTGGGRRKGAALGGHVLGRWRAAATVAIIGVASLFGGGWVGRGVIGSLNAGAGHAVGVVSMSQSMGCKVGDVGGGVGVSGALDGGGAGGQSSAIAAQRGDERRGAVDGVEGVGAARRRRGLLHGRRSRRRGHAHGRYRQEEEDRRRECPHRRGLDARAPHARGRRVV